MTPFERRFWAKVRIGDGCWEWIAATKKPSSRDFVAGGQSLPHGVFWLPAGTPISADVTKSRTVGAHRASLAMHLGVSERSLVCVQHMCDNPLCVRPSHLADGSHGGNVQDTWDRQRRPDTLTEARNLRTLSDWFDANPIRVQGGFDE